MKEISRRPPRRRFGRAMLVAVFAIVPAVSMLSWFGWEAGRVGDRAENPGRTSNAGLPLVAVPPRAVSSTEIDGSATESGTSAAAADSAAPATAADDASLRRRLLGKWTQYNYGKRLLTVLEDGTATIVAEPDGVWKFLFGARIRIDIVWKLENGRVTFETTGGEPVDKADLVAEHWGRTRDTEIVTLTDQRLALLEAGDDEPSEWTRAE